MIKKSFQNRQMIQSPYMTTKEAAEYVRLNYFIFLRKVARQEIPHLPRNGKKLFFLREQLDAWMTGKVNAQ